MSWGFFLLVCWLLCLKGELLQNVAIGTPGTCLVLGNLSFNFFIRRPNLTWSISQGCTTGMLVPTRGQLSATFAVRASPESLPTVCLAKVNPSPLNHHLARKCKNTAPLFKERGIFLLVGVSECLSFYILNNLAVFS